MAVIAWVEGLVPRPVAAGPWIGWPAVVIS
jgi:hypothetical protein